MGAEPEPGNFESRACLDDISEAARGLGSPTDTFLFIKQLVSLSSLLSNYDKSLGDPFPTIDENALDPAYFLAAYFDTRNMAEALWVYRVVRSLTRFILLSDRFHEAGNDEYALFAKQVRESAIGLVHAKSDAQYLAYSIDYSLEQFSEFWKFEQMIKRHMLENHTFSYPEIRHYTLSKSSDASIVYAKVLDARLPSFNENVALVLHYNQALLDILDDWEDIEDDVQEGMPNVVVMAAVYYIHYDRIKQYGQDAVRKAVLDGANSWGAVGRLVDELHSSIKGVSIPENFSFLKILSDRYADTLRGIFPSDF